MSGEGVFVDEGAGVETTHVLTHHGLFFGHFDNEIEQRQLPPGETLDPDALDWPDGVLLLRVVHRITRIRRIWGEDFPGESELVKSKRVYLPRGVEVVRDRSAFEPFKRRLRDSDDAERLLKLGNVEAIVVLPEQRLWGKMRQGESVGGQAA